MKIRALGIVLLGSLAAASMPASATDLSYDYAELRFVNTEIGSADGDGLKLGGSYEINPNWLILGSYSMLDFDGNVDTTALEIGGGYVHRYNQQIDFVGTIRVVRATVDFQGGDDDETGFALSGGIRGRITPNLEGRASINYFNVDETDTFFELGGDYYFNDQFSAGATLEAGGDADTLTLGVRWFFGN